MRGAAKTEKRKTRNEKPRQLVSGSSSRSSTCTGAWPKRRRAPVFGHWRCPSSLDYRRPWPGPFSARSADRPRCGCSRVRRILSSKKCLACTRAKFLRPLDACPTRDYLWDKATYRNAEKHEKITPCTSGPNFQLWDSSPPTPAPPAQCRRSGPRVSDRSRSRAAHEDGREQPPRSP